MKTEMITIDRAAVEIVAAKRGYTAAEIAGELTYNTAGYESALKRGRMPVAKFNRLVKILDCQAEEILPKVEKPVQESLFDATPADLLAEMKAIRNVLEGIAVMLEGKY